MYGILEKSFGTEEKISLKSFTSITENVGSEIFLYILFFLLESRPFRNDTLDAYDQAKKIKDISKSPQVTNSRLIASPCLHSKFSPSDTISKSPMMTRKSLGFDKDQNNMLLKLSGKSNFQATPADSKNVLLKYAMGGQSKNTKDNTDETDEGVIAKNVPVARKNRNNLRNIETIESKPVVKNTEDIPIMPAHKYKPGDDKKTK